MIGKVLAAAAIVVLLFAGTGVAEKNGVLVIIDGLGSAYIYPDRMPSCVDGTPLIGPRLDIVDHASARYELWVPAPDTESGNTVIATGYSEASDEAVTYYGGTIYDVLRAEGYLTIAIMETGDAAGMIAEPDIIVYERNNSLRNPEVVIAANTPSVPPGLEDIMRTDLSARIEAGRTPDDRYRLYDEWPLETSVRIIDYMGRSHPGQKYLLVLTVAGTDMAAHERGYDSYCKAIEALDEGLSELAETCRRTGTVMIVTADHGMSFRTPAARGSHASGEASLRNETRLVPVMIFSEALKILNEGPAETRKIYGQQCLAPTLLSLMECPDTLAVADGVPLPLSDRHSLYLISDRPVSATVENAGFHRQVTVNGTCRIGPIDAGSYKLTSPWGVSTVALDHDVTLVLAGSVQGDPPAGSWVPYAIAAVVAAAGIVTGLGLMRRK